MATPYNPQRLPMDGIPWDRLVRLVGQANRELATYGGVLEGIVNPYVLLSPLSTREAVLSSKIEGTQATLQEVLAYEADGYPVSPSKEQDIHEILNYRSAMGLAVNQLERGPLTLNLIRQVHAVLLDSVRGHNKRAGEFRTAQNWIGRAGCSMEEASYIPPSPLDLGEALSNLEKYIHYNEQDPLVQVSIIHAQFELIHPFMDGNGRLGRMLVPLFLFEKRIIPYPTFYISSYLESHRSEYYERLGAISARNDWEGWISFFLQAILEEAQLNTRKARDILALYEGMKTEIPHLARSSHAMAALDRLFYQPIFASSDFIMHSGIPKTTALRMLKIFEEEGILQVIKTGRGSSPGILAFGALLQLVENHK